MEQKNPPNQTGTLEPGLALTHRGSDERLEMNKYHVLLVIERLLRKPKGPSLEHVLIPFALFLGTLLTLLPLDFRDFGGVSGATWEAFALIATVLSGVATVALFIWWCVNRRKYPSKTAEEIVEDICNQMAEDRERAGQPREQTRDSQVRFSD